MSYGGHSPKVSNLINGAGLRVLNPALVRTGLGLGTMATQNSNSVSITGGSMSGVAMSGGSITNSTISTSITATLGSVNASGTITSANFVGTNSLVLNPNAFFVASNKGYNFNATLTSEMVSFLDGTNITSCTGVVACSSYTYLDCPTDLGCIADAGVDCAAITDEGDCSAAGCTPEYTPTSCSVFTDETSCNAQSPCSWDGTDCLGTYDVYSGCGGDTSSCSGSGDCTTLTTDCTDYTGCSVTSQIDVTLPSPSDGQLKTVINISLTNSDANVYCPSGVKYWDGTISKTLASFADGLNLVGKTLSRDCAEFSDEYSCVSAGCSWDGTVCSGSWNDTRWMKYATI